jgi:leader peptidase (prepilin peptidase) / N-methyltransferase
VIDAFSGTFFFLLGAAVGSFLNVCIARWPHELSVVKPRSRCPTCGQPIAWYDNVPLVSWLVLRGRCRHCGNPISVLYPAVELLVALGWLLAASAFGPTFTAVRVAVFATLMLGIAVTDARHYLIPDGFTVFGLIWVLGTALAAGARGDVSPFAGTYDALIGACAGAGAIAIVGWLGEVALKKEAMGFGDVTLMAVVGGALGPGRALLAIFLGAMAGAIGFALVVYPIVRFRRRDAGEQMELEMDNSRRRALPQVPFGVFLAPTAIIALVWGEHLISWYVGRMLAAS